MRTIKLTDNELDHLRSFYELELAEATQYVGQVKSILTKLSPSKEKVIIAPTPSKKKTIQKKPVRVDKVTAAKNKPTKSNAPVVNVPVQAQPIEPKKRGRKPANQVLSVMQAPTASPASKPIKTPTPSLAAPVAKPKKKRKGNYKRKGIVLSNWSKPLPKKPDLYQTEPEDKT